MIEILRCLHRTPYAVDFFNYSYTGIVTPIDIFIIHHLNWFHDCIMYLLTPAVSLSLQRKRLISSLKCIIYTKSVVGIMLEQYKLCRSVVLDCGQLNWTRSLLSNFAFFCNQIRSHLFYHIFQHIARPFCVCS